MPEDGAVAAGQLPARRWCLLLPTPGRGSARSRPHLGVPGIPGPTNPLETREEKEKGRLMRRRRGPRSGEGLLALVGVARKALAFPGASGAPCLGSGSAWPAGNRPQPWPLLGAPPSGTFGPWGRMHHGLREGLQL